MGQLFQRRSTPHQSHLFDAAIDASLARLQTDYVDLYQLHWPDRPTNFFGQLGYTHVDSADETPIGEILTALEGLVVSGKIRAIGSLLMKHLGVS